MSKLRVFIWLITVIGVVFYLVAPAYAEFEAANGKSTSGKGIAGNLTFTDEGASVTCEGASGTWTILSATKQVATKRGPDQRINVTSWKSCILFGFVGAEVKPCAFVYSQGPGSNKAIGSVVESCIVIAKGNCELKVPATKANENLTAITLENSGSNLIDTLNVSGITSTATSLGGLGCVGIKTPTNSTSTFKGTLTGEGAKAV